MNNSPERTAAAAEIAKATINTLVVAVTTAMQNHDPSITAPTGMELVHLDDYSVFAQAVQLAANTLGMTAPEALARIMGVRGSTANLINKLAEVTTLAIIEWTFAVDIPYGQGVTEMFRQDDE